MGSDTYIVLTGRQRILNIRLNIMKNKILATVVSILIAVSPVGVNAQQGSAGSASGGMSVGTAVAIGVVGAALLVALGDSSSSAPAAVSASASSSSSASTSASTATTVSTATTTSTTAATATTN